MANFNTDAKTLRKLAAQYEIDLTAYNLRKHEDKQNLIYKIEYAIQQETNQNEALKDWEELELIGIYAVTTTDMNDYINHLLTANSICEVVAQLKNMGYTETDVISLKIVKLETTLDKIKAFKVFLKSESICIENRDIFDSYTFIESLVLKLANYSCVSISIYESIYALDTWIEAIRNMNDNIDRLHIFIPEIATELELIQPEHHVEATMTNSKIDLSLVHTQLIFANLNTLERAIIMPYMNIYLSDLIPCHKLISNIGNKPIDDINLRELFSIKWLVYELSNNIHVYRSTSMNDFKWLIVTHGYDSDGNLCRLIIDKSDNLDDGIDDVILDFNLDSSEY